MIFWLFSIVTKDLDTYTFLNLRYKTNTKVHMANNATIIAKVLMTLIKTENAIFTVIRTKKPINTRKSNFFTRSIFWMFSHLVV
ncbi:hypothetical protein CMK16_07730 [Candidatus Poribacteria bacterium]|nr:hypothetical protein [Candidatus Poribacteria bacterium]